MNKKWAILLVLVAEAVIYLFLLVGFPMFTDWVYSAPDVNEVGHWRTPLILYFIPGIIGAWFIFVIIKQKKESKR